MPKKLDRFDYVVCSLLSLFAVLGMTLFTDTLGESRIAFCLGYAFAQVLHQRGMPITDGDLEIIAKGKIITGKWPEFVNGFRRFQP